MSDIIHLLPDAVANQIAAGEVIQRPASAVKELMENAVDSGATEIKLIIKDAGKSLIQVVDNGCGMSLTDARLCFERHATSKVSKSEDLFSIRTLGFRGEALASIAAIAQVEMKTRRESDDIGTQILIEGAEFKGQEATSCSTGTSITVKNLFFNVPARRNFLKSDAAESAHILEEFFRLAITNPDIGFSYYLNNKEQYHLNRSNIKQRIVQLFGSTFGERIVNIEGNTGLASISGFIGKPEFARKTRGEQYFFVNHRYIRHPFFHHAVETAYRQLIPDNHFPSYIIFFEVDPATLDINIHPTKTEVKFLNERILYSLLHAAVKQGLGKFNLTPSLDFDSEPSMNLGSRPPSYPPPQPQIQINPDFNPFISNPVKPRDPFDDPRTRSNTRNWEKLYEGSEKPGDARQEVAAHPEFTEEQAEDRRLFQLKGRYVISAVKSGMMVIDQQRAHERILYEYYLNSLENQAPVIQQELFPTAVTLSPSDATLLAGLLPGLHQLGLQMEKAQHGSNTFIITGTPGHLREDDLQYYVEEILENYKNNGGTLEDGSTAILASAMAGAFAIKAGRALTDEEINKLVDDLFSCQMPDVTPSGKPIVSILTMEELSRRFK